MSTKLTYTGAEVQELLDKIEKGDFDNAKTLGGHPASYFAIASEFTSLAESFATEQGRVNTLYSYFNNGSANDALSLGGQLPSYYATATQYEILQRTLSDFKSLFDSMFEKDSDGNIHAKLSLWSSGGITAGGVGSGGTSGGGASYDRLDSWSDYSADKSGWVLSALLGNDLNTRLISVENAGYITQSALAPYALRSEIPSLEGYATLDALNTLSQTVVNFKSLFDSMFEVVDGNIHAKLSLWSSGGITAGGVGSGGSGGGGASYDRLDSWSDYSADKAGYVLSAALGYDINTRLTSVENAGYVTASALAPYVLRSEVEGQYLSKNGGTVNGALTSNSYISGSYFRGNIYDECIDTNIDSSFRTSLDVGGLSIFIKAFRIGGSDLGALKLPWSPILAWGVGDTHAFIQIAYNEGAQIVVGGGSGNSIKWSNKLIHSGNYADYITNSYIKSTLGISDWALASVKPTYTASEVGALAQDSSSTNADLDTILDSKTAVLKPFFQAITGTNIGSARKGVLRMSYNGSESQLLFDHYNRLLRYRTIGENPKDWATIAFTSDIPTKLSQLTDDVVAGKYLSKSGGTVSGSITATSFIGNLTGTADNANNLENIKASGFARHYYNIESDANDETGSVFSGGKLYGAQNWVHHYGPFITVGALAYKMQFNGWGNTLWYRAGDDSGLSNKKWREVAFADSNVASATKLATPRTIWGQSFDGTGNITGDIMFAMPYKIAWHNDKKNYYISSPTTSTSAYLEYNAYGGHSFLGGNVTIGGGPAYERLCVYGNGKFTGALTANSLTIGGATITYDSVNEALCINGNMYALGGITAGGAGISAYTSLESRVARLEQQLNIS